MNKYLGLLLLFGLGLSPAYGESTLHSTLTPPFVPEEAVLLATMEDGTLYPLHGALLPPVSPESPGGGGWYVGATTEGSGDSRVVSFRTLLVGGGRTLFVSPPIAVSPHMDKTAEELREELGRARSELQALKSEEKLQEVSVQRVRSEAAHVINIERIVEIREQVLHLKEQYDALESERKVLEASLISMKSRPAPRNFARREFELTRVVSELGEVVKKVESEERLRNAETQSKRQRKLSMIEGAKSLDGVALAGELAELRKRRAELEREKGI